MATITRSGSNIKITLTASEIFLVPASDIRVDLLDGKIAILANNDRIFFDDYDVITSPAGGNAVSMFDAIAALVAEATSPVAGVSTPDVIMTAATSTSTGTISYGSTIWWKIVNIGDDNGTVDVGSGTVTLLPGDSLLDEEKVVGGNLYKTTACDFDASGTEFLILKKIID